MFRAGRRTTTRRPNGRHAHVWLALALSTAACAASQQDVAPLRDVVPETVELGRFPAPLSDDLGVTVPATEPQVASTTATTTTQPPIEPLTAPVADVVDGNRILLIGDTVFASTAPRHDGAMCDVLEAFGWEGEIAAEFGRFVDFGRVVLDARLAPGIPEWDAVAVMFGNHFNGDLVAYRLELDALLTALSPRPVILYTLAEDDTFQAEINEVVRAAPSSHPNVVILDWADIVAAEPDVLLADTPSGLSEEGLGRLALFTVATLGEAPPADAAGCLPPIFVDDSAIVI